MRDRHSRDRKHRDSSEPADQHRFPARALKWLTIGEGETHGRPGRTRATWIAQTMHSAAILTGGTQHLYRQPADDGRYALRECRAEANQRRVQSH